MSLRHPVHASMYAYICIYIYVGGILLHLPRVQICTYVHICIRTYVYIHTYLYIYMYIEGIFIHLPRVQVCKCENMRFMYIYICVYTCAACRYVREFAYVYIDLCVYIYIYIYIYIYVQLYVYM